MTVFVMGFTHPTEASVGWVKPITMRVAVVQNLFNSDISRQLRRMGPSDYNGGFRRMGETHHDPASISACNQSSLQPNICRVNHLRVALYFAPKIGRELLRCTANRIRAFLQHEVAHFGGFNCRDNFGA